ncbi:MAG: electron transfer flavoprotein subunit beta/FixA family protein [Dehalococcoidales bacterium]|nr:electron transfer flavoprotein subunit beta/FixA family protein [Dehalococcoidales bacterium]
MNIIVCVKQVIDPEAPPSSFKIDASTNQVVPPTGMPPVISTFDEYAVEAALRIKEKTGGKITAISLGVNLLRDVVKKPLSMGVDDLVLLEDPAFVDGDSWSTAYAISMAIKKIGQYDIVLCGRQAADWDAGQVGSGIAEILGLPSVNIVRKIEVEGTNAKVEKVIPDGFELIEVGLPAVFTLSNEHATPRYPNVKGIMMAKRKEPIVWKPADIGADPSQIGAAGRRSKLVKLFQPVRESTCEVVTADTPEEAASKLAQRLREVKVL